MTAMIADPNVRGRTGMVAALHCRISGHKPDVSPVWNEGRHFSHCRRCGAEIMRGRTMVWRTPMTGERIEHDAAGLPRLVRDAD